jgi:hypothetical protein
MKNETKSSIVVIAFWGALIAFLLFLFLGSCTPQRRLDRFQRRHPYLFTKEIDTIRLTDTVKVMIPGTELDTFISVQELHDTVFIQKDNMQIKAYIYNDTLFLSATTDTIYKEIVRQIKVPYAKYIHQSRPRDKLRQAFNWLLFFVICFALYKLYRMIPK